MLKTLFWLLLTINAALLAWGQGLFAAQPAQRREPQRMTQQLHPEQLALISGPVGAAPAPTSPVPNGTTPASASPSVAAPSATTATTATTAAASSAITAATAGMTAATALAVPAAPIASPVVAPAAIAAPSSAVAPAATPATPSAVSSASPASAPAALATSTAMPGALGHPSPQMPAPVSVQHPIAPITSVTEALPSPPAAIATTASCVDVGNFDPAGAQVFRNRLNAIKLGGRATQRNVQEVSSHMVYIPPQEGRAGAERKAGELRRLGITDFYIMPESSVMPGAISLGLFKTEAAAKAQIGKLIGQGVRSARIAARTVSTNKLVFRLRGLSDAELAALTTLSSEFPLQTRHECVG